MKNKRLGVLLAVLVCLLCTACGTEKKEPEQELELNKMQAICEMTTMKCTYHNVAKYFQEDAAGVWIFKKDKNFWIEYDGVVELGIDASKLSYEIEDDVVTITLPETKVLNCYVDSESLGDKNIIKAGDSAKIKAEDTAVAFEEAQSKMQEKAEQDEKLLSMAQDEAKLLLSNYVKSVGKAAGKNYTIEWKEAKTSSKK